jgi:hypothetical protein
LQEQAILIIWGSGDQPREPQKRHTPTGVKALYGFISGSRIMLIITNMAG